MTSETETPSRTGRWAELAACLRADAIRCTTAAGSGHPTSALSAADLMAVLLDGHLRRHVHREDPANDHLVFSKGHACPLLYAMLRRVGAISEEELLSLRSAGSRIEGHPTPLVPWVEAATGSLGQGLPFAVGLAIGARLDGVDAMSWVLLGDSEMAEGSNWEAFDKAAHYGLDSLVAIIDVNRLGQRGPTALGWNLDAYRARAEAFGWRAIVIDGHDHAAIDHAYRSARERDGRPTCIIARTEKGHGVASLADRDGWHGKVLPPDEADEALRELGARDLPIVVPAEPTPAPARTSALVRDVAAPRWAIGEKVSTRRAYGEALRTLGSARDDVVVLDAEVGNSTYAELFAKAHPDRFVEIYIAEQQLVSAALGLAAGGRRVFASTFAAFFTRAFDQIRMAAVSRGNLRLCGSHAGVSIGEDGPSQMGLEDLAMLRTVHGSTVLYPSDGPSTARLVATMAELPGISYLRTTRESTPVLYGGDEVFPIGGSKLLREGGDVAIVAAGITLHQALRAADELSREGIDATVVDLYSIKPIDVATLARLARDTDGMIVVEDHWPQGGIGEAVLAALATSGSHPRAFAHLAVRAMPGSASPAEQLMGHGIDAPAIAAAVRAMRR